MKNVRIWFKKDKECKYISHLDLNRCMLRALHKSKIPIWHTEGFNPHPFVTFALPLSLGFEGEKETMDIRLLDEDFPMNEIISRLNACLPDGIRTYYVAEPVMKPGSITYALFQMQIHSEETDPDTLLSVFKKMFSMDTILMEKKTKKGFKEIDLKESFGKYSLSRQIGGVELNILLPAGSTNNVNPGLILDAVKAYYHVETKANIVRKEVYNDKMEAFI